MVKHTLKILQRTLQVFKSFFDHLGTLCIKGLTYFQVSRLLQYVRKAYLRAYQISVLELFYETSERLKVVNCFRKKASL